MFFQKKRNIPEAGDAELLLLYRNTQDSVYIGELYKKYARQVLGTCFFYLEDREEAKDAVMQIFDKLLSELLKREITCFHAWLGFVVRNHCISLIRKRKSETRHLADYYEFEKQEAREETELKISQVSEEEMILHLNTALEELKEQQQICIRLFYISNKSYQTISNETGYSLNEVKSYIQNGKRKLKLLIEEKRSAFKHIPEK